MKILECQCAANRMSMNRQKNSSTGTEARSVEWSGRASYSRLLDIFCLFARPTQELARSSELVE